jgi:hypothetical protein
MGRRLSADGRAELELERLKKPKPAPRPFPRPPSRRTQIKVLLRVHGKPRAAITLPKVG